MKNLSGWILAGTGVVAVASWLTLSGPPDQVRAGAAHVSVPGHEGRAGSVSGPGSTLAFNLQDQVSAFEINGTTIVEVIALASPAKPEIGAFREWAGRYFGADPVERGVMEPEGIKLAKQHRLALKTVIATDPQTALEQAVPMVVRQALPQDIVDQLEERLSGTGSIQVLAVSPDSDPSEVPIRRFAVVNGREYRARVYGRRGVQASLALTTLNGVAVDNEFAVNQSPLRVLEIGERPDASKQAIEVCPVSGESTTVQRLTGGMLPSVTVKTPVVEMGSQVVYLCDGGHIRQVEEELVAAEGGTGGRGLPLALFLLLASIAQVSENFST